MIRILTILQWAVPAILLAAMPARADNASAYTELDFDSDCVTVSSYEAGGTFACSGYKGYPVLLSEGDLRTSVFYGHIGPWFKADGGQAFWSFGTFNNAGNTIEWRLDGEGVPFAAIQRFHLDDMGDGTRGSVLAISRVGQPGEAMACVVAFVDATRNADANVLAREAADTMARDADCSTLEPEWLGDTGDTPPATMNYRPDRDG